MEMEPGCRRPGKPTSAFPTTTTAYELCLYDGERCAPAERRAPKGDTCRTNEPCRCWKENAKGYGYVERDLRSDGL